MREIRENMQLASQGFSIDFVSFEDYLTSVFISNISYYISNCNSLVPEEALKVKLRIWEIKRQLKILGEK